MANLNYNWRMKILALFFCSALLLAGGCSVSPADDSEAPSGVFTIFQAAAFAIGQPDLVTGTTPVSAAAATIGYPFGVFATASQLFIADQDAARVLVYNTQPTASGASADYAIGQAAGGGNLTSNATGSGASQFAGNTTVFVHGTKLLVPDEANNKILIWSTIPEAGEDADIALGHSAVAGVGAGGCNADEVNSPSSVFVTPQGKILATDPGMHRILIWNSIEDVTTGASADIILGDSGCNSGTTDVAMDWPAGVWSDDERVIVADYNNNRVLLWNTFPTASQAPADVVLGQANFTGALQDQTQVGFTGPWSVDSDGTHIYVSDAGGNRVMIWNTFPTANATPANVVLGQSSFTLVTQNDDDQNGAADGNPSARTLYFPGGLHYSGGKLYVADRGNSRVLVFESE